MWRYRYTVLLLCLAAYFAIRFAQLVISPVVPAIIDTFGVSRGAVGLALTGMWAAYALSQLPSGVFGNRFGERAVVLVALAVTALGAGLVAGAPVFPVLFAVVLLLGIGAGLYYNAATALLTRLFENVGRAVGTHRVGSQVAGLVAPVAAAVVLDYGWRVAPLLGGVVSIAVLGGFALHVRSTEPVDPDTSLRDVVALGALSGLLRRPAIALPTAVAMLGEFVLLATMSFLPTFLVEHHGIALPTAGFLFSAYFVAVAVSQPASGWLSDRIGRDAVLVATMSTGIVGFATLAAGSTITSALPAVLLAGFGMSWTVPLQSRVMDALSAADRGAGFGLVRTLYILFGALGPTVVGTLADVAGWSAAFWVLVTMLGGALALLAGFNVREW